MRASSIHDNAGEGIEVAGAAAPWISHNEILRNGLRRGRPGVAIAGTARPTLTGNVFAGNRGPAVEMPAGPERELILKFNYLLGEPPARRQGRRAP